MNFSELSNIIKSRRKSLHLTQQELADLSELNINTIVSIERSKGDIKISTFLKISNTLGLNFKLDL